MNPTVNLIFTVIILSALYVCHVVKSCFCCLVPGSCRKKKDIEGLRVLITGAGSGVGRELAVEFSKHATSLVLVGRNRQTLLETEKLLDPQSRAFVHACDVSDYKKVYEMADRVQREVGAVDILVNNAGIVSGKCLLDLPEEEIIRTMEVNVLGQFWTCKAFLPSMAAYDRGHIVTVSSIAGHTGCPKLTDYCASKFAGIGFSEALEMELKSKKLDGIKVTVVCPSHIDTGLFDGMKLTVGTPLTAKYVAKEIVAGIQEEKETIFLPHYFNFMFMVKAIVPRWLNVAFCERTDNLKVMDNFTGRSPVTVTTDTGTNNLPPQKLPMK